MALPPDIQASLRLPMVCAPMNVVTGPELVGAACAAGIMAGLPRHNARDLEEFETWLVAIRDTLNRRRDEAPDAKIGPLCVNLGSALPENELSETLALCDRYGVRIIISAMGDPTNLARRVHDWGGLILHDVTSLRFAEKAIAGGVDGLTCIGAGGGGHCGTISAMALVPKVRAMFDGIVLLAGAIASGTAIRAAEVLGADLAYLGTRFIATREARASERYKAMLVSSPSSELVYTRNVSGVFANWLKASLVDRGLDPAALPEPPVPRRPHLPNGIRPWHDVWSAGQGVDLINDVPGVAELVDRLAAEYRAACATPMAYPA
jgi:nitronate monooxygenase